jgi:hypothetical protein
LKEALDSLTSPAALATAFDSTFGRNAEEFANRTGAPTEVYPVVRRAFLAAQPQKG